MLFRNFFRNISENVCVYIQLEFEPKKSQNVSKGSHGPLWTRFVIKNKFLLQLQVNRRCIVYCH
jgi:hypothetical protein